MPLLTGAAEVRFEIVPGGHLGMLTGRAARAHDLAGHGRVDRPVVGRRHAEPVAPAPAGPTASRDSIGANPTRRYGSAGSRSLGRG